MSEAPTSEAQFMNKTDEGKYVSGTQWESYESVITADGTHYKTGDIIHFKSDPVGMNGCEHVMSAEFAARIKTIKKSRGNIEFQTTAPIGRISASDVESFIPMDEDRVDDGFNMDNKLAQDFLNQYLAGDAEEYIGVAIHYAGDYPEDFTPQQQCDYCDGKNDGIDREIQ